LRVLLWVDLFERLQPFAGKRILVGGKASSVGRARLPTTPVPTGSERFVNTIGIVRVSRRSASTEGVNHVGFEIDEFLGNCAHPIEVARGPAIVGAKVASLHPAQFLKGLPKGRKPSATFLGKTGQQRRWANMREFLDALCYVISHDNPIYLRNIGGNLLNVLVGYVPLLI